jgi:hypothetical protein
MEEKMPNIVRQIGELEHMNPIAWSVNSAICVIVFEQGPKKTYTREQMLAAARDTVPHNPRLNEPGADKIEPIAKKTAAGSSKTKHHKS